MLLGAMKHRAVFRFSSCGRRIGAVRRPSAYFAASTRVLSAEYCSILRMARRRFGHGRARPPLLPSCGLGGLRSVKAFVLFPLLLLGVSFSWHLALHRRWNKNKKRGAPGCGVPFFCNKYSLKEFGFDLFCGQQLVCQFLHGRDVGLLHAAFDGDGVLHDLQVFHVRQHARHDPSGRRCP